MSVELPKLSDEMDRSYNMACKHCAAAIRALKSKPEGV